MLKKVVLKMPPLPTKMSTVWLTTLLVTQETTIATNHFLKKYLKSSIV